MPKTIAEAIAANPQLAVDLIIHDVERDLARLKDEFGVSLIPCGRCNTSLAKLPDEVCHYCREFDEQHPEVVA